MRLIIGFLFFFQLIFSQTENKHGLNVGLLNQVTILSYNYEYIYNANYRFIAGYSPFYGNFKEAKWNFEDDALLLSVNYLLGQNKNFSVGIGTSQQINFSGVEVHLISGYTAYFGDVYFRSAINIILNDN